MAHFRLEWIPDRLQETDVVEVKVLVAFNGEGPLRDAGSLRLHAHEMNALDQLLTRGLIHERPGNTFDIVASDIPSLRVASNGRR